MIYCNKKYSEINKIVFVSSGKGDTRTTIGMGGQTDSTIMFYPSNRNRIV